MSVSKSKSKSQSKSTKELKRMGVNESGQIIS